MKRIMTIAIAATLLAVPATPSVIAADGMACPPTTMDGYPNPWDCPTQSMTSTATPNKPKPVIPPPDLPPPPPSCHYEDGEAIYGDGDPIYEWRWVNETVHIPGVGSVTYPRLRKVVVGYEQVIVGYKQVEVCDIPA